MLTTRPDPSEYNPYYQTYIGKMPDGNIVETLRRQIGDSMSVLEALPAARGDVRYAPGKWTLRQGVAHLDDTEWVFTARAPHSARKVDGKLPGVEQEDMIAATNMDLRPLDGLLTEWRHLREAGAMLFSTFDEDTMSRTGIASGNPFSVRSFPWIIAGHERHHLGVIRERYLI
jgi:hypothetical protein